MRKRSVKDSAKTYLIEVSATSSVFNSAITYSGSPSSLVISSPQTIGISIFLLDKSNNPIFAYPNPVSATITMSSVAINPSSTNQGSFTLTPTGTAFVVVGIDETTKVAFSTTATLNDDNSNQFILPTTPIILQNTTLTSKDSVYEATDTTVKVPSTIFPVSTLISSPGLTVSAFAVVMGPEPPTLSTDNNVSASQTLSLSLSGGNWLSNADRRLRVNTTISGQPLIGTLIVSRVEDTVSVSGGVLIFGGSLFSATKSSLKINGDSITGPLTITSSQLASTKVALPANSSFNLTTSSATPNRYSGSITASFSLTAFPTLSFSATSADIVFLSEKTAGVKPFTIQSGIIRGSVVDSSSNPVISNCIYELSEGVIKISPSTPPSSSINVVSVNLTGELNTNPNVSIRSIVPWKTDKTSDGVLIDLNVYFPQIVSNTDSQIQTSIPEFSVDVGAVSFFTNPFIVFNFSPGSQGGPQTFALEIEGLASQLTYPSKNKSYTSPSFDCSFLLSTNVNVSDCFELCKYYKERRRAYMDMNGFTPLSERNGFALSYDPRKDDFEICGYPPNVVSKDFASNPIITVRNFQKITQPQQKQTVLPYYVYPVNLLFVNLEESKTKPPVDAFRLPTRYGSSGFSNYIHNSGIFVTFINNSKTTVQIRWKNGESQSEHAEFRPNETVSFVSTDDSWIVAHNNKAFVTM